MKRLHVPLCFKAMELLYSKGGLKSVVSHVYVLLHYYDDATHKLHKHLGRREDVKQTFYGLKVGR